MHKPKRVLDVVDCGDSLGQNETKRSEKIDCAHLFSWHADCWTLCTHVQRWQQQLLNVQQKEDLLCSLHCMSMTDRERTYTARVFFCSCSWCVGGRERERKWQKYTVYLFTISHTYTQQHKHKKNETQKTTTTQKTNVHRYTAQPQQLEKSSFAFFHIKFFFCVRSLLSWRVESWAVLSRSHEPPHTPHPQQNSSA